MSSAALKEPLKIRPSYWILEIHQDVQSKDTPIGRKIGLIIAAFLFIIPILIRDGLVAFVKDFARAALINQDLIDKLQEIVRRMVLNVINDETVRSNLQNQISAMAGSDESRQAVNQLISNAMTEELVGKVQEIALRTAGTVINNEAVTSDLKRQIIAIVTSDEAKRAINQVISDALMAEQTRTAVNDLISSPATAESFRELINGVIEGPKLLELAKQKLSSLIRNEKLKYQIAVAIYDIMKNSCSSIAALCVVKPPIPHVSLQNEIIEKTKGIIETKIENLESFLKRTINDITTEDYTDVFNKIRRFIKEELDFSLLFTNEADFKKTIQTIPIETKDIKLTHLASFLKAVICEIVESSIKDEVPTFILTIPAVDKNPKHQELMQAYKTHLSPTSEGEPETGDGGGGGGGAKD